MAGGLADIKAGAAFVELYLKNSDLLKGLKSLWNPITKFGIKVAAIGGSIGALGAAGLAPLYKLTTAFADAGSQLADMSARTGASAETLSALGYAAGMTGSSMEDVEKALRKMQQNGMSIDQLGSVADKMAAITDPAERTRYAIETFGKSGTALIPMLSAGAAGLAKFRAEAEHLGLVMSSEDAAAADELGDAMDRVRGSLKGAAMQVGAALAPMLTKVANIITDVVASVVAWLKNNKQLVVQIAIWSAGITAVGAALIGLGGIITGVGVAISLLVTTVSAVGAALGFILSPVGLVLTAVVGATYAFLKFTESGRILTSMIRDQFGSLLGFVKNVFGGIVDAFNAGDMTLAANVAWAGVKLAFWSASDSIMSGFDELKAAGAVAWSYIKLMFVQTMNPISALWDQVWTGMTSIFDGVITSIRQSWGTVISWIAKQMLWLYGKVEKVLAALGLVSEATDIKGAQKIIDEDNKRYADQLDKDKAARDQARGAKLAKNEKERADSLAAAEKERQDAMSAWAGAGAGGESPETKAAREELDRLRKQAADAAAAAWVVDKAGKDAGLTGPGLPGKGSVASSFSAAALSSLGNGGGVMDRLVRVNEDQKKNQQRQIDLAASLDAKMAQLNTMLALTP
jgi:signal transduction histidine kinase